MTVDVFFKIDCKSPIPVYLQIVEQVKLAAATGALREGDGLPSIRPLAEELKVNRNTVAKAYAELEALGLIESFAGKGSVISGQSSRLNAAAKREILAGKIDAAILEAHHLQISHAQLSALLEQRLRVFDDHLQRRRAAAIA